MAYEFKLPDIGEGVVEGEIVKWLVAPGDTVSEDQPLVEIMTDKASVEIPSPKAGKIVSLNGEPGAVVAVGQVLVVIDAADGASAPAPRPAAAGAKPVPAASGASVSGVSGAAPAPRPAARAAQPASRAAATTAHDTPPARLEGGLPARSTSPLAGHIAPAPRRSGRPERVLASPSVRRKARELGVDLAAVAASGAGGRVTHADLGRPRNGASGPSAPPASPPPPRPPYNLPPGVDAPPPGGESRTALRGVRKAIAGAMQRSKNTAAHFTFVEEVDMRKLVAMRGQLKGPAAEQGVKLNYLPFFVKAACIALERHPQLNCTLDEETQEVVYRGWYNIGVAAATDAGLMVPVVKHADRLSLVDIAREVDRLAAAARAGKAKLDEIQGSTFTITSLGAQGGLFATPIVNFPEVAIMGIHQIKEKPIVEHGEIVVGQVMLLSLSFDHRLVDGHVGAAFCYEMVHLLENPERLLLELR